MLSIKDGIRLTIGWLFIRFLLGCSLVLVLVGACVYELVQDHNANQAQVRR